MLVMHGGAWLTLKAEGKVQDRARRFGSIAALVAMAAYVLAGVWLAFGIEGYRIVGDYGDHRSVQSAATSRWRRRHRAGSPPMRTGPWIAIAPLMGIAGAWR
jgi:cytochrome d ubiquinol oxidase subunit II